MHSTPSYGTNYLEDDGRESAFKNKFKSKVKQNP